MEPLILQSALRLPLAYPGTRNASDHGCRLISGSISAGSPSGSADATSELRGG